MSDLVELPPVRDQGERETCLSMALSDGHQVVRQGKEPYAVDYLHFHATQRAGTSINGPVSIDNATTALEVDGQPDEEACPYSTTTRDTTWKPPTLTEDLHRYLTDLQIETVWDAAQDSIEAGRPVVLLMDIDDSFWTPVDGVISSPVEPVRGSHALLAVDVDSDEARIRVRNSWGEAWGNSGYAWLSSAYVTARCFGILKFEGGSP